MNGIQLLTLTILLATFRLLVMEETIENPLLWNNTHVRQPLKLRKKTVTRITRVNASDHGNNYYNFYDKLTRSRTKFANVNLNTTKNFQETLFETSTENGIYNVHTTIEKPFDIKRSLRDRSHRGNNLRKSMRTLQNHSSKERTVKNCGSICDSSWNPVFKNNHDLTTHDRDALINNVNQYLFTKPFEAFTEAPAVTQLTAHTMYKQDNNNVNNHWWNIFSSYITSNKIVCNNSIGYGNQRCAPSNNNNITNRRHDVARNKKSARYDYSTYGNRFKKNHYSNSRSKQAYHNYRQFDNYEDSGWSQRQADDGNAYYNQMADADDGYRDDQDGGQQNDDDEKWKYNPNKMKDYRPDKYRSPENVQYFDDNAMAVDDKDPETNDDGYKWHPNSHDDDGYNKWYYNQHDVSKYEDKRAISRLQDMYYCTKYCHCCKKGNKRVTLKYNEFGAIGKILSIMKYFGYDSGYNFFYGRSADHSHNPLTYFKEYYKRFYGPLPGEELVDDESFVFFNKDKDQPEGVSDCKEVCSCCEDNKKEKLKKKLNEMKRKEAKRKRKLKGLTGIIRYLLFSDDEGYYDFVDDDGGSEGRSYSRFHYNGLDKNRRVAPYEPQTYDSDRDMDTPMQGSQDGQYKQHDMDDERYPDDSDHEDPSHDMEQHDDHDNDVEEHHHPKLILFDCSKCCRFCKKPEEKPTRRRRRRRKKKKEEKKGLLDFLQGLLTGELPDSDDGGGGDDGGDDGGGDDGGGGEKSVGDVSLSASGGENTFYFEPSISLQSGGGGGQMTSPASNSTPCCFNSSSMNSLIVVVTVAIIVIQAFSSVNVIGIVIVPLIFIGLIIIFIFLLLQAIIPVYFIPVFIIVLIIVLIPIVLLVILFFLLLPLFLFPIFFPFILKLPGIVTVGNITSIHSCCGFNSSINCTIGSDTTTTTTPVYPDNVTEAKDYFYEIALETTTYVSVVDFQSTIDPDTVSLVDEERRFQIPDSLYWKIYDVLTDDHCLERAGCHLAIFTHSVPSYNRFILRILENLSRSINETKFTAYKDAYQIGSFNVTNHKTCSTLYYCNIKNTKK